MDLNTALMESITNMSEYFVAANTRTSFTEMAESGSLSSIAGHSNQTSIHHQSNLGPQFAPTVSPNQLHKTLLTSNNHPLHQHHQHHQQQQQQQPQHQQHLHHHHHHHQPMNPNTNNNNNHNTSNNHNNNSNGSGNNSSNTNNTNPSPSHPLHSHSNQAHHQPYHNHSYSPNNSNSNNNNNAATSSSSLESTRLSQPIRTQIPIHCYIEQLDACADVPCFGSPLNDADLFNTTSNEPNKLTQSQQQPQQQPQSHHNNNNNNNNSPHLHQSKLALESVTNCNGNTPGPSSLGNPGGLFNENDTTDNDNNDHDSNLDHINSSSPISINQSTTAQQQQQQSQQQQQLHHHQHQQPPSTYSIQTNSIGGNTSNNKCFNRRQPQAPNVKHHFQSCRETYAIVTSNVLYIDLVRTVLLQLGYSAMDLINAKATIQIKNWRPLAMDQVTEDKRATVGEVLGDISTFVTLRIRLYSSVTQLPTEWTDSMIRQVVLALTQTMSQSTLSRLCSISQPLISSIVRGGKKLGRRKCAEFGQWYMNYIKSSEARPSSMFCEGSGARLVFDKSTEIPQLKTWFTTNTKPSDELLEEYSRILNQHALRKDRPQVTAKTLRNWWKNERQKLGIRQREVRRRSKSKRID